MAETSGEEAPLLGAISSPSHTITPPLSPSITPLHSSSRTLQVPQLVGIKTPRSQGSTDSGCESDSGEAELVTAGLSSGASEGAGPNNGLHSSSNNNGGANTIIHSSNKVTNNTIYLANNVPNNTLHSSNDVPICTLHSLNNDPNSTTLLASSNNSTVCAIHMPNNAPKNGALRATNLDINQTSVDVDCSLLDKVHDNSFEINCDVRFSNNKKNNNHSCNNSTDSSCNNNISNKISGASNSETNSCSDSTQSGLPCSTPSVSGLPSPGPSGSCKGMCSGTCSRKENDNGENTINGNLANALEDVNNTTCTCNKDCVTTNSSSDIFRDVREAHCRTSSASNQDLSTKVTFRIEGEEGQEDEVDRRLPTTHIIEIQPAPICEDKLFPFPRISSNNKSSFLSTSSSTTSMPFCRICHLPEGDGVETLISPCRCAGTMEFIHHGCLMKWLEVSSSRARQVPSCELCNYQFHRRKKFRIRQCQMPTCSRLDKILHIVFLICVLVMLACAAVTVVCFKQNSNPRLNREDTELTNSEVVTLTCGVLFFVAFFVAMYVEVKATDTLYRLCASFFYINQTMHIYEYDRKRDTQYCNTGSNAPV